MSRKPVVVYYVAMYHKPYQFAWLLEAMYNDTDLFLVHVDRSAADSVVDAVRAVIAGRPNVVLLPRITVQWGAWSQVEAELRAIRHAVALATDWQYFINLSGQDYPIQSVPQLYRQLEEAWPRSYIRAWSHEDIRRDEPDDPHLRNRVVVPLFGRLFELPIKLWPVRGGQTDFKGSSWHVLSRGFCGWVVSDPLARRLARRSRFSPIPDESYFQAAIMSSPFRAERMPDSGRFVIWPGPKVLDGSDEPALLASSDLFARKFDAEVDRGVLAALAAAYGYGQPPPPWAAVGTT